MPTALRPYRPTAGVVTLALMVPFLTLSAQTGGVRRLDSLAAPVTSVQAIDGEDLLELPLDSVSRGLILLPGVEQGDQGLLQIRGSRPHGHAVYLDGVPVGPGQRTTGFLFREGTSLREVSLDPALRLGVNSVAHTSVTVGAYGATRGNALTGIVATGVRARSGRIGGSVRYATDEIAGTSHGPGINRVLIDLGGSLTPRLRFFVGGVVEGRQSADNGPGTERVPLFVPGALDTTVVFPAVWGDPASDLLQVPVNRFTLARGRCDEFAGSANRGIADNYGIGCTGVRLPSSARSTYQLAGKVDLDVGPAGSLFLSGQATQDQTRLFDYANITNALQLQANRGTSLALTAGYRHHLGSPDGGWNLFGAVSLQRDQAERGPLTRESEADTWFPTGGFMLAPFDFRFGFDRFPIDDRLVANYRDNVAGSRRSPYDLENANQYRTTDTYRNNPSATGSPLSFSDGGGPAGQLGLFRESRVVAVLAADWLVDAANKITLGGEYTHYSITNYIHQLTSQAGSDVYRQKPRRAALYLQDRIVLHDVTVIGGLRLDSFDSRARRPFLLDLSPGSPTFDQYVYFPRTVSYQGTAPDGRALTVFREDPSRSVLTPHVQLGFAASPAWSLWISAGQQVQVPDFRLTYTGVNTDWSITDGAQAYGADLDFDKVNLAEVGLRTRLSGSATLEASVYYKDHTREAAIGLVSLQDPFAGRAVGVLRYHSADGGTVKGVDTRVNLRLGDVVSGFLAYSYANSESAAGFNAAGSRPHSLTGSLRFVLPDGWHAGTGLGAIGQNAGLFATWRFASGTPYTRCPQVAGNEAVLSGGTCTGFFVGDPNSFRLPTVQQLDLRLTKGFRLSGAFISTFLDIRNVLDFGNTHTVFAVTGTTASAALEDLTGTTAINDYASEAASNGALQFNGDIVLPAAAEACVNWIAISFASAAPNCIYLIRAEERYGNGDRVFDLTEQERAVAGISRVALAPANFRNPPRRIRLGLEVSF